MRRRDTDKLRCREHWRLDWATRAVLEPKRNEYPLFFSKHIVIHELGCGRAKSWSWQKSSDLGRGVGDLVQDLDVGLDPNEVRGTRPISMGSLNLRFIILGDGDSEHQVGARTAKAFSVITCLFISFII